MRTCYSGSASTTVLALVAAVVFAIVSPPSSLGAPVVFFGQDLGQGEAVRLASHPNSDAARANFFLNLNNIGTENLESFATNTAAPLAAIFPGAAGTATLLGNGAIATVVSGTNGVGRYPISGDNYWEASAVFSLTFSQPISAFGFYGVDIGDFQGSVTLTLAGGGQTQLVIPHTVGGLGGSVIYFGFYDAQSTYTGITFGNSAPGVDFFGFDDFSIGDPTIVTPTTGACCRPGAVCSDLTAAQCAAAGGAFIGVGSSCSPNPCQQTPTAMTTWGQLKTLYR